MEAAATNRPVMMICPNLKCRKVLQVPSKCRGQQVKCHFCGTTFAVPAAKAEGKTGASEAYAKKTDDKK